LYFEDFSDDAAFMDFLSVSQGPQVPTLNVGENEYHNLEDLIARFAKQYRDFLPFSRLASFASVKFLVDN
jgi:hypothetical protein